MIRTLVKINIVCFLLLVIIGTQNTCAGLGSEEYRCPLFGPYAILRSDLRLPHEEVGLYQLVKITEFDSVMSSQFIVAKLKKVAVKEPLIVGSTETSYFIFDTSQPDAEPQTFADAEHWHNALKIANFPPNIQLNDPDVLAATIPDRQLHPFHYRMMKGRFGLSDDDWGGIVMLTSLAAIFVRGLLMRPNASLFPLALLLAWFVTAVLIFLNVLDSGGFTGFIIYPGLYWLVGKFGRFLRRFVWDAAMGRRAKGPLSPV